jgi:hypothetical protein
VVAIYDLEDSSPNLQAESDYLSSHIVPAVYASLSEVTESAGKPVPVA